METETKNFKLGPRNRIQEFPLKVSPEYLFMPNAVTRIIARNTRINPGDIVFDIGSGVGPLAIWSGLELSKEVHAVEIVKAQYELLKKNIKSNSLQDKVHAYHGPFFGPLPQELKADVIIADVSGIADGPARALGWYPPEIPTGGEDGTSVIVPLLEQAGPHLAQRGRLYFPVAVDLSNSEKTMEIARTRFRRIKILSRHNFPLDDEQVESMMPYLSLPYVRLQNLRSKERRTTWVGEIYEATSPI